MDSKIDPIVPVTRVRSPLVRAYPYPFKAWLTLSSDPDNTLIKDWEELDRVIWKELGSPFADTLFLRSFNTNLPDQVDLARHPAIYEAHPHDSIHTWGDYVWAGQRGFDRGDAEEGIRTLKKIGFTPRVWVDHSMFMGNMLHTHRYGSMPEFKDAAGYSYPNPVYTLDLAHEAGVRYLWDGTITPILGQDRPLSLWTKHRTRSSSHARALGTWTQHVVGLSTGSRKGFRQQFPDNELYRAHCFPDGRWLYVFQRFGRWELADIDGLGTLLAPTQLDDLIATGGASIVYTHLGKRPASRAKAEGHVTQATRLGLETLHQHWKARVIQLSSTAKLLDYVVLRDHMEIDKAKGTILFKADKIAFDTVETHQLAGHSFTILDNERKPAEWLVNGSNGVLEARIEDHGPDGFTLHFEG